MWSLSNICRTVGKAAVVHLTHPGCSALLCLDTYHHRRYLKLADFGLAEVVEPNGTTRTLKGTLKYISPEVAKLCRGLPSPGAGRPSDLWSVGVTLLEMSTGKESPFTVKGADGRTHMGATLDRIIAGKFR